MSIRVSIKRRDLIVALLITGLLAGALIVLANKDSHGQSQAKFYARQLDQIKSDVDTINSLNDKEAVKGAPAGQIDTYQVTLESILVSCRKMDERYGDIKADKSLKDLRKPTETAKKLCQDLAKVSRYALSQSRQTEAFMLFPADSLNGQTVAKLQGILNSTRTGLEELNSDPIKDPALPEQITLMKELQKQTKEAKSDTAKLSELTRMVEVRQGNLLDARAYFWKNSIDIAALEKAIIKARSLFSQ